jgi:hypothetical protein
MRLITAVFVFLLIGITSCGKMNENSKLLTDVKYKQVEFRKTDCPAPLQECVKLSFNYPEFSTKEKSLKDSLNLQIKNFLLESMYPGIYLSSFEAFRDTVFREINSFNNTYKETPISYVLDRNVKVVADTLGIVTITMFSKRIYGESPAEEKSNYVSFTPDGKIVTASILFRKESRAELKIIAEKVFRKEKGIKEKDKFFDAGFYFAEDTFFVPNSLSIMPNGIRFQYERTELSTDSGKAVSFVIPFNELKSIAVKNGLLSPFIE